MSNPEECKYRGPVDGVSEAIKGQGIYPGLQSCSRPGEQNIDRVCGDPDVSDPLECPTVLFETGKIDIHELFTRIFGE